MNSEIKMTTVIQHALQVSYLFYIISKLQNCFYRLMQLYTIEPVNPVYQGQETCTPDW